MGASSSFTMKDDYKQYKRMLDSLDDHVYDIGYVSNKLHEIRLFVMHALNNGITIYDEAYFKNYDDIHSDKQFLMLLYLSHDCLLHRDPLIVTKKLLTINNTAQ